MIKRDVVGLGKWYMWIRKIYDADIRIDSLIVRREERCGRGTLRRSSSWSRGIFPPQLHRFWRRVRILVDKMD